MNGVDQGMLPENLLKMLFAVGWGVQLFYAWRISLLSKTRRLSWFLVAVCPSTTTPCAFSLMNWVSQLSTVSAGGALSSAAHAHMMVNQEIASINQSVGLRVSSVVSILL